MPPGIQPQIRLETPSSGFLGMDTASEPTSIDLARSRRLYNAYQGKIRALTKRPGSIPVTATPLASPIVHLTKYKISPSVTANEEIYASSGTTLYKFNGTDTLTPLTMTNALNKADIYTVGFTNSQLTTVLVIGDSGILKRYNGTDVKDITPAPDDPSPAPANALADINAKGHKYVWEYSGHVFSSPGTNEVFYSKRFEYDYWPEVQFFFLVHDNDFVNGPGVAFDNVCLIPMRRGWNILTGENFDNFEADKYLNTIYGVIAPRSIATITYPDGKQTIAYLSDNAVHEVFTAYLATGGKQYATQNLMENKIDFSLFGFTEAEKAAAKGKYVSQYSMYLLEIERDGTPYIFGYDTRNTEWYIWTGLKLNALVENEGVVYFAGNDGHLKKFDPNLYSDWADKNKTTGTPVDFDRISGLIAFEETGYDSTLDYYILRLKQYDIRATLDISLVHLRSIEEVTEAIQNYFMIWDVSEWDEAAWANLDYTDLVSAPKRLSWKLRLPKKGYYFQVRWRNPRDEPVEIYGETFIGRTSGEV